MGNDVSKINVNPSNYIQGNNQMNNYSNSRNGNLMQVNNSVSTADTSGLQARSTQVEELDFNIETTTTNTSNIPIPENNSMAQIEMLEQAIAKSLENLEQQEKYLRESYNKFANAPQNSYPGLYFDGNRYLNPSEYASVYYSRYNSYTYGISPNNSNTNGYAAINGAKTVADSTVNLISIEEYTKMFNEYFEKTMGYDYNQYQENINLINQELSKLKASKYPIAQMKKQQPYLDMLNTKEYKDYVNENANNTSFSSISLSQKEVGYYHTQHIETILVIDGVEVNPAEANLIKIAMELEKKGNTDTAEYNYIKNYMYTQRYQFLTENDKLMYSYLYDTKGKKAAYDYLEAIKDDLNRREGQASAEKFIKGITDENGDIETEKLSTYLKTSVKGFLDGNDNFYDGLANISATEGMVSVNQYEQMYILQYLTNSKGIYIEKILETKSPEEAQRISEGIYTADGKINHQFAKENLTEAEYLKLLEKIQQDEFGILDESYQISTSIGNMAPSMLVSATANILLPGSSFALMGSTLMGLSSGGNSLNQALIDGNDLHAARMYGLCSGLSETTVGYLLGNIPYLSKVSEFSIKGILKEGLEEGIQEFVDAGMRATILGEHIELNQLGQDALKSFIYGCVTSFIMNGGQATVEFSINGVMHRYDNINDFIDGMKPYLPDDVQSQFDNTQINDTTTQTNANIDEPIIETTSNTHNTYNSKISWNDEIARANNLSQVNKYSSYILEVNTLSDIPYDIFSMLDSDTSMRIKIGDRVYKPSEINNIMKNYIANMESGKISLEDQYNFWNKQLELKLQQLNDTTETDNQIIDKMFDELNEISSKCENLKSTIQNMRSQNEINNNLNINEKITINPNTDLQQISWNDMIERAKSLSKSSSYGALILEVTDISNIPYNLFNMLQSDNSMRIKIGDRVYKPSEINNIMKNYIANMESGKISLEDQYNFWNKQLELKLQQLNDTTETDNQIIDKMFDELNEISSRCEKLKSTLQNSTTSISWSEEIEKAIDDIENKGFTFEEKYKEFKELLEKNEQEFFDYINSEEFFAAAKSDNKNEVLKKANEMHEAITKISAIIEEFDIMKKIIEEINNNKNIDKANLIFKELTVDQFNSILKRFYKNDPKDLGYLVTNVFDNEFLTEIIETKSVELVGEIIKSLNSEQFAYVKNNLEGGYKNELAIKYQIKELYDARVAGLISYTENYIINRFSTTIGFYVPYERIQTITGICKFVSKERFKYFGASPMATAFNDGKNNVMNMEYEDIILVNNISHESIHQLSANDSNGIFKRGFSINGNNDGINECVTEYLNELVMGNQYYTEITGEIYSGYQRGVEQLKKMIDSGILNKEKLIEAYFKNDLGYVEREITKLAPSEFFESLLKDFDDAISDDYIIKEQALKKLESKIEIMKQIKAGIL